MNLLPFILVALAAAILPLMMPGRRRLRWACVGALWVGSVLPLALHALQVARFIRIMSWKGPLEELTPDPETTADTIYDTMFGVTRELQSSWLPLIVVLIVAFLTLALWPPLEAGPASRPKAPWWRGAGAALVGLSAGIWLCWLEASIVEVAEILGPEVIGKHARDSQPGDKEVLDRTDHELKQYQPALVVLPFVALSIFALQPVRRTKGSTTEDVGKGITAGATGD